MGKPLQNGGNIGKAAHTNPRTRMLFGQWHFSGAWASGLPILKESNADQATSCNSPTKCCLVACFFCRSFLLSDGISSARRTAPQRFMKAGSFDSMLCRGVWSRGLLVLESPRMSLTRDCVGASSTVGHSVGITSSRRLRLAPSLRVTALPWSSNWPRKSGSK